MQYRLLHKASILLVGAALAVLAGCGSGARTVAPAGSADPTFTLSISPDSRTTTQGTAAAYTLTLTSQSGFSAVVTPTVTGLPAGATAAFSPSSVTPTATGAETTLTVTAAPPGSTTPTPAGTYPLTVSAISGAINRQTATSIVVTALPTPPAPGSLTGAIQ